MLKRPLLPEWRYWPAVPAAALLVVAGLGLWMSPAGPPSQSPNRQHQETIAKHHQDEGAPLLDTVSTFIQSKNGAITAMATILLSIVTGGLVWVAYFQLRTTRRQLRAYVAGVPDFIYSFDAQHVPRVRFKLINTGPTPAKKLRDRAGIELLPEPLKPGMSLPPLSGNYTAPMALFPNTDFHGNANCGIAFTQTEIDDIRKGKKRIYLYGELKYEDIFGDPHTTLFCHSLIADDQTLKKLTSLYTPSDLKVGFEIAPMGNDAD